MKTFATFVALIGVYLVMRFFIKTYRRPSRWDSSRMIVLILLILIACFVFAVMSLTGK